MLYCPNFLNIFIEKHLKCCTVPINPKNPIFKGLGGWLVLEPSQSLKNWVFWVYWDSTAFWVFFQKNIKKIETVQHFCCFFVHLTLQSQMLSKKCVFYENKAFVFSHVAEISARTMDGNFQKNRMGVTHLFVFIKIITIQ